MKLKFKSSATPDLYFTSIQHKLELMLIEQRSQRADLATIKRQLHTLIGDSQLQKQVDTYFEDDQKDIPEVENGTNQDSDNGT